MRPRKPNNIASSACERIVNAGGTSIPPFISSGMSRWFSRNCTTT
jgi:hypothetical protein